MLDSDLRTLSAVMKSKIAMIRKGFVSSKFRRHRGDFFTGSASAV
jgi:hypothetical protein